MHPWDKLERAVAADRAKPRRYRGPSWYWAVPAFVGCSLLKLTADLAPVPVPAPIFVPAPAPVYTWPCRLVSCTSRFDAGPDVCTELCITP